MGLMWIVFAYSFAGIVLVPGVVIPILVSASIFAMVMRNFFSRRAACLATLLTSFVAADIFYLSSYVPESLFGGSLSSAAHGFILSLSENGPADLVWFLGLGTVSALVSFVGMWPGIWFMEFVNRRMHKDIRYSP